MEKEKRRWLVAITHMHHEKKVRDRLQALDIKCYIATQKVKRRWSDRVKAVEQVLISMYAFVYVNREEEQVVLKDPGVRYFLQALDKKGKAVVPEEQMEQFIFMLDYSEEAVQIRLENLTVGQRVRVTQGPLKGLEGEFYQTGNKGQIIVNIAQLCSASVSIPIHYVTPL